MEKCKTCVARNEGGYCTSKKFDEGSAIEFPNGESDDMLLYSYHEDGGFWVGDNFGCVHHKTKETKMESLAEALPKEQSRVREIIVAYRDPALNGAGNLAAAMMEQSLKAADEAVMSGDIAAMMRCYQDLKSYEL